LKTITIAVFGSAMPQPKELDYENAHAVGRALCQAGYAVMTGGYMGVMGAVSQGACEAGGHVIGVTCEQIETYRPGGVNEWVKEEIKYPTLEERLNHLILRADGYVIMPGGLGTLNELVLAWELMRIGQIAVRPLVCFGKFWEEGLSKIVTSSYVPAEHRTLVTFAHTPEAVVDQLQTGFQNGHSISSANPPREG
jgi:uncharacterized protein (TIGR00730 family)